MWIKVTIISYAHTYCSKPFIVYCREAGNLFFQVIMKSQLKEDVRPYRNTYFCFEKKRPSTMNIFLWYLHLLLMIMKSEYSFVSFISICKVIQAERRAHNVYKEFRISVFIRSYQAPSNILLTTIPSKKNFHFSPMNINSFDPTRKLKLISNILFPSSV